MALTGTGGVYFVIAPIAMPPTASTVTVNEARRTGVEASEIVIKDVPALTETIRIFPERMEAVATPSVPEVTEVPTTPSVASSLAVELLVVEAKGAVYLVIAPIVMAPLAATVAVNEAS